MKYNCTRCGAGISADKTLCAECEKDDNMVEVVRCKDCIYLQPEIKEVPLMCKRPVQGYPPNWYTRFPTEPNGYCWEGKRRMK